MAYNKRSIIKNKLAGVVPFIEYKREDEENIKRLKMSIPATNLRKIDLIKAINKRHSKQLRKEEEAAKFKILT